MTTFLPWSLASALGLAVGIAAASVGVGLGWVLAAAAFITAAIGVAPTVLGRSPARPRDAWVRFLVITSVCLPLGTARMRAAAQWTDPLAPLAGTTAALAGRSDGRFLHVAGVDGRVALYADAPLPRGELHVQGSLRSARAARTPGGFDEIAWLRGRRASLVMEVHDHKLLRSESTLRTRARAALAQRLDPSAAQLLRAMVLGEREGAGDLRDRFARSGLAHLLALSGLHLGVVAAALGVVLAPLGRWRWLVVAGVAGVVPMLLGPSPSLVRAALMTAVVATSVAYGGGRVPPAAALGVAATIGLLARPAWLFDVGFQLSYLSLGGILAWGLPAAATLSAGRQRRDPRVWLASGFVVSAAAWTAGLPVVASAFGSVAPFAPIVNLLAVPLAGLLVPIGAATAVLGAVGLPLGGLPAFVLGPLAASLLAVAEVGARLPSVPTPTIGPGGTTLFGLAVLPWAWAMRGRLVTGRALRLTLLALAAWAALPPTGLRPELIVLDVGQGDAVLLRLPGRKDVLVDGGGTPFGDFDVGAEVVVPALRALGVTDLDLVVATHPDLDHVEGLRAVLRALPVGGLAHGRVGDDVPAWSALAAVADSERVPRIEVRRGHRFVLGDATLHVLHPSGTGAASDRPNDDSVVLRIDWRGRPWALLAGDVSSEIERALPVPRLPLLLAPHHGSPGSTSAELLRAARPEMVAISVGRNRYGHPAEAVLERIRAAGAEAARTDRNGTLRFVPAW